MSRAPPVIHVRTISVGRHRYVQKVQYLYDERKGRNTTHVLESRPLQPIYRRPPPTAAPPFETYPCTLLQLGLLATHLLNGTLTAEIALHLIGDQAVPIPPETLQALGVRVAFKKKTVTPDFDFLLWRSPPSPRPCEPNSDHALGRSRRAKAVIPRPASGEKRSSGEAANRSRTNGQGDSAKVVVQAHGDTN